MNQSISTRPYKWTFTELREVEKPREWLFWWELPKGSRDRLIHKHAKSYNSTCANGWYENVLERYFRRIKYTCLDSKQGDKDREELVAVIRKKWPIVMNRFDLEMAPEIINDLSGAYVWVGGKQSFLTIHQFNYLRKLSGIVAKFEKLDERRTAMGHVID